jgi:serine protease
VEIYRDGSLVALTANDGEHQDEFTTSASSVTYVLCEEGGTACSEELSAVF